MIEIKLNQKYELKDYVLIEGFPGAGLVGPMAISYIIDKTGMKYIGYIESSEFPPLVAIHGDQPMPPVRIYVSDKLKIVTILAEFAIPMEITYDLTKAIYEFVKSNGISKIISIGGIPTNPESTDRSTVFAITSNERIKGEATKAGMKPVGEGVASGVSALIMLKAVADDLSDINVLVPVDPNILDPKYAELAITSINKLIKLNVDVTELEKEAKEVEAKIKDLMKRNKEMQDAHKKAVDATGPSMYA